MCRGPNFTLRDRGVNARLAQCLNSVLNVKALVGAYNQEKALVGAFSVIVQPVVEPMEHYTALAQILATIFAWIPSAHILVWIEITALVVSCVQ